ncbi:hypothetical protein [Streptomyces sp. NPDC046197]|uniref:hypothetical protein n=1 Tax=Streptomyces sp. NPDC046197 TaxID=3154337 RepID=UPI0033C13C5C
MRKRWRPVRASYGRASEPMRARGRTVLRGATAGLLPLALAAGLLGASPATAADDDSVVFPDRELVVDYWRDGGSG